MQAEVPAIERVINLYKLLSESDTHLRQPVALEQQLLKEQRMGSDVGQSMLQLLQVPSPHPTCLALAFALPLSCPCLCSSPVCVLLVSERCPVCALSVPCPSSALPWPVPWLSPPLPVCCPALPLSVPCECHASPMPWPCLVCACACAWCQHTSQVALPPLPDPFKTPSTSPRFPTLLFTAHAA